MDKLDLANKLGKGFWLLSLLLGLLALGAGCSAESSDVDGLAGGSDADAPLAVLELPQLEAADISDGQLKVVATTSIIGDIVSQVGGENIDLTVLMAAGKDPHSFELTPSDLASTAKAQVIFVNGWNLEERLLGNLASTAGDAVIVPVSAGIFPLPMGLDKSGGETAGEDGDGSENDPDPHTWLDPQLVVKWVDNISQVLSDLDPNNEVSYQTNAEAYKKELREVIDYIDEQAARIPADGRRIVTSHDSLAYFADAYGFEIVGTVIPAASTLAEPSGGELAALIQTMREEGICAIFTESTANDQLAQAAADELEKCAEVKVVSLFTGALGAPGSGAEDYLGMMRSNIDLIVDAIDG